MSDANVVWVEEFTTSEMKLEMKARTSEPSGAKPHSKMSSANKPESKQIYRLSSSGDTKCEKRSYTYRELAPVNYSSINTIICTKLL